MKKIASIICLGQWNSHVFSPKWVADNVFPMPQGDSMQINLDEVNMMPSFVWHGVQLTVTGFSLELKTEDVTSETLDLMNNIFRHVLEILCHTPISAIGYNVGCKSDETSKGTLKNASFTSQELLGYKLTSQKYTTIKDFSRRSIEIRKDGESFELLLNFEFNDVERLPKNENVFDSIIKTISDVLEK